MIIHDDLLATGGTAKAATELVLELGGQVVGYSFIIELSLVRHKLIEFTFNKSYRKYALDKINYNNFL